MPVLTIPLTTDGPVVDVYVMLSAPHAQAVKAAGGTIPKAVRGRFLIDTGASGTVIDTSFVGKLGLLATGAINCHTPSTGVAPAILTQYDVGLILGLSGPPHAQLLATTMPVIATDFSMQPIDGLLGRDILSQCLMGYNGPEGHIAIAI